MLTIRSSLLVPVVACALLFTGGLVLAADGTVEGIVTLKGKPVASGRIIFHLDKDQFVGARIQEDGSYRIDRVPAGTWKITIEGDGIDPKFSGENKTPLVAEVKEGKSNLNIELK